MKIFLKSLILSVIFSIFLFNNFSFADDFLEEIENSDYLETTTDISKEPTISSKNVIVLDRKTSNILYEKNANEKVPMASTTKIMTCILALETSDLNEIVTISSKASHIHGSTLGISSNSKITMLDLLYGLMLRSGNDCAIAIAEHIAGSIENFAVLMNEKAKKLKLNNTNFVTPHGLDDENHYTTAYELALLTNYALENETFRNIVSTKTATIYINNSPRTISNTNELLGNLNGVYGVKTGFTFNAGRCLVTSCKRNSLDIITVVLGSNTKKNRTLDSKNLIEYTLNKFEYFNTYSILENNFKEYKNFLNKNFKLEKTTDYPVLELSKINNYTYPLSKEDILHLNTKIYTISTFSPQLLKNSKVGYITLYTKDKILFSLDIILTNTLNSNSWQYYFKNIIKNYFTSIFFI